MKNKLMTGQVLILYNISTKEITSANPDAMGIKRMNLR